MGNFGALIQNLIQPLLSFPQELEVLNLGESDGFYTYCAKVSEADLGRVIGKTDILLKQLELFYMQWLLRKA